MFETTNQIIHGQSLVVRKKSCSSFALWLVTFHFVQMLFWIFWRRRFCDLFFSLGHFSLLFGANISHLHCASIFRGDKQFFRVTRFFHRHHVTRFFHLNMYIDIYIQNVGWGTTLLGVLGVNSFIGCYQCFPINSIVGLDLAFLIKHYHVISFCFLSSHWCFTRCRHDSCSILPKKGHKSHGTRSQKQQEKKQKQETKEPSRQMPQRQKQNITFLQNIVVVLYF